MNVDLEHFLGEHYFSGASFDSKLEPRYDDDPDYGSEERSMMRFTVDGINYEAVEDPDDGYRSSLKLVRECSENPIKTFTPIPVVGRMRPREETDYNENIILQLLNQKTGLVVMEFGTSDSDDYYPGFVAEFHPENL